jgi:AraC family transcriptional regulator
MEKIPRPETMMPRGHFWGQPLRAQDVRGLTLTEYSHPPSLRVAPHRHESAYLSLVLRGGYEEHLGARTRTCSSGTVTFHVAGEQHSDHFGANGARTFTIEFEDQWLARASFAQQPVELQGGPIAALLLRTSAELARMDDVAPLAIEGLAMEAVAEIVRSGRRDAGCLPPPWLERARELVAEEFRERLTLGDIAAEAGVHPVHLVREFRRFYGSTIGAAIRQRRIELASRRLATTGDAIVEIALDAGFANQSHFSAAFKRVTGLSPARYRRQFGSAQNATNAFEAR